MSLYNNHSNNLLGLHCQAGATRPESAPMMATPAKEDPTKDEDISMGEPSGVSSPQELRNALYARCATFEENYVFDQNELLSFNILPENNVEKLIVHTNRLTKDGLFKLMTKDGKACWKVVKRSDAAK